MLPVAGVANQPSHDYTEGASAIDIDYALNNFRRSRRDSQYYSTMHGENEQGAVFAGPGHSINPSSASRMSNLESRKRSSDNRSRTRRRSRDSGSSGRLIQSRRLSTDSQVSHQSIDRQDDVLSDEEAALLAHEAIGTGRRNRTSLSPAPRAGVLENLAHLFGRTPIGDFQSHHRRSISQLSFASTSRRSRGSKRSDAASDYAIETDNEELWGYFSGEEDSDHPEASQSMTTIRDDASLTPSMEYYDSDAPSPAQGSYGLPLIASDPVFGGETRLDMDIPSSLRGPPPPGPPTRQTIYVPDEDNLIHFVGYGIVPWRAWVWRFGSILTLGALSLLGHWFPRLWLLWVTQEKAFVHSLDGFVVVESAYTDIALFPIRSLDYPYHLTTVFPSQVSFDEGTTAATVSSVSSSSKKNGYYDPDDDMLKCLLVVDYRYSRFALDPRTGLFGLIRDWRDPAITGLSSVQCGQDESAREQRHILFGNNEIDVEAKSTLSLLVDEVIHPFYIFQLASITLWSLDDYYYYAFCIALISISSITATLVEMKKTIQRMREMSHFSCKTKIRINGLWVERDSVELVPGDIVNLSDSQLTIVPADLFLLSGDAILNESMLTGESVPVTKIPAKENDLAQWQEHKNENPKSMLYGGTKVIRIRGTAGHDGSDRPALALVLRTGFNTTKGALVRSMLFPRPVGFKFYRDSIRFIGVLAGIAGVGFCFSAIQFVRMELKWHTILIRALDLVTVVVPPALPATLSIGTSFAISRLRKSGIFCISPSRVNVGGKINVCCFDKTGTLTEEGLDILGVRGLQRNLQRFGELFEDIHDLPLGVGKATFLYALATCHSLKMVNGEVIGDPLDAKMFEFTKWTLEEGRAGGSAAIKAKKAAVEQSALVQNVVRPPGSAQFRLEDALKGSAKYAHFLELGVIRIFEFVSSLRRMSVVVKRLKSTSMEIYVKGAPEVMVDICDRESLPQDYDDLLSYYTRRGYRVIAVAGKSIEGLTWLKAQKMKREQAESRMRFLGLIIFENRLKPGTAPTIQTLRAAHVACRMITGDNPLTAVSVARECSLINQTAHVFSPTFIRGNAAIPTSQLEWSCMDDFYWKLDPYSLKPLTPPPHHTVEADEINYQDYSIVVTGDVFRWMISYAPLETLQRMLVKTQIFSRMSPDEKNEVVERLQSLGYTVLMCGDGANDCAALKAADVGISLSEAEASVAAPFTTNTPDIGCVIEVIKQGRAALVTSFSCFKYMALYSLIQFTSVTLLYSFASSLGDFQFLYIDLFIIIPVAVAMGRTLPYPRIYPKPPTASLVSKKVLVSIIGQIIITSATQLWAYIWVRRQTWYKPPQPGTPSDGDRLESTNFENSVLFLVSCFQYILVAAVFSIGPPYREPMWTNGWLMASVGMLSLFNVVVLLWPPPYISELLNLMKLPSSARGVLLVGVMINVVGSVLFERHGAPRLAGWIGAAMRWRHGRRGTRKAYKVVERGMR